MIDVTRILNGIDQGDVQVYVLGSLAALPARFAENAGIEMKLLYHET